MQLEFRRTTRCFNIKSPYMFGLSLFGDLAESLARREKTLSNISSGSVGAKFKFPVVSIGIHHFVIGGDTYQLNTEAIESSPP